jgi:kynurenine 3-monooxygenase
MSAQKHFLIVGAGLAGSLLGVYLTERYGARVTLCEYREDPRAKGFVGGRSINLALSARGIDALSGVGLAERVLADAIPMRGRIMHAADGRLTFQRYSKNKKDAINSVSRGGLNITLIEAAAAEGVELRFGHKCVGIDPDGSAAVFEHSGEEVRTEADAIIGADGAHSAVRKWMQKSDRFTDSQEYLTHGYKELLIPPASECGVDPREHDGFAMDPNALHIWPRGGAMMIALPNADRTFTCTLFWPHEGEGGFDQVNSESDARAHMMYHYSDAVPLMPTLDQDFQRNPVSSLMTVRCYPWVRADRVALIGDAAHAVVPFYGQGMNAAFEDVKCLSRLLGEHGMDIPLAFDAYQKDRKPNADAIADLAISNFTEMRDKVGSKSFLLKKRVEKILHVLLPWLFTPLYNMVSFTTIPYAKAVKQAKNQRGYIAGFVAWLIITTLILAGVWPW